MKNVIVMFGLAASFAPFGTYAVQDPVPSGIPKLEHVFVIMMENHAYGQIAGNPQAPSSTL
ncbi:MAG TPA: hypothetical protein VGF89_10980 [Steroidobacteraceae bacterium]|jgi:hypothetical protein